METTFACVVLCGSCGVSETPRRSTRDGERASQGEVSSADSEQTRQLAPLSITEGGYCGDSIVEAGEECDPPSEGCSSTCQVLPYWSCQVQSDQSTLCAPTCGDGYIVPGTIEQCDDGNTQSGDGCAPADRLGSAYPEVCSIERGWDCTGQPTVCDPICGDGLRVGSEQCDDGANNSDVAPNACRTNCRAPSCGDGVIDDARDEACDETSVFNGQPGLCSLDCLGGDEPTLVNATEWSFTASPVGLIGVLTSDGHDEEILSPQPPDYAFADDVDQWLNGAGFVVGFRVTLAAPYVVDHALRIYDGGATSWGGQAHVIAFPASSTEPMMGPVQLEAGDNVVLGLGSAPPTRDCDMCSTGGVTPLSGCFDDVVGDPFPPVCGQGNTFCPQDGPWAFFTQAPADMPVATGEPTQAHGNCVNNCAIQGMTGQCDTHLSPEPLRPDPCVSIPGGLQDRECWAANVTAYATTCQGMCPGAATSQNPVTCSWLEEKGSLPLRDQKCGIESQDRDINGDSCGQQDLVDFSQYTIDQIEKRLREEPLAKAWGDCTSDISNKCAKLMTVGLYKKGGATDDDAAQWCASNTASNPGACVVCVDRAGGACFPSERSEKAKVLDDLLEFLELNPTTPDTKSRAMSLSQAQMRFGGRTTPGAYNPNKRENEAADPVILSSGELAFSATDVSFPSRGVPFTFTRHYRSGGDWHLARVQLTC